MLIHFRRETPDYSGIIGKEVVIDNLVQLKAFQPSPVMFPCVI